ncbi:hypothetical protein BRARA_I04679 [Brassica rapa]|uniref:Epidermal patterning factor-like protein n=3 Tax=Brassica TaxID=3705 RepID=A0A078FNB7_BRANA|nr:protein EPIDERMAL PATTERNING FACTOR 1 [Brassica rapa]XP_013664293.1 protein EPIDERMAL PATTERNING FACTOR 1 [Brassica napus]RID48142.1 hypothetical protein BRARA_I04679 [Brassica rapa]CAF2050050.1 unnamed protein product [Brassica napus]CAG7866665.1 unnamed protein product [Brassica rapa]CDY13853.1 BnaA09g43550D [Brassica napus]VDC63642.1 unnamed protein product [Brassica rapa]
MKSFLLLVLFLSFFVGSIFASRHFPTHPYPSHNNHHVGMKRQRRPDTVQVAGSRLPDCSHACGSCSPCRLVMVSFVCASIEEAETCPMAYKCMCKNKSYPVP